MGHPINLTFSGRNISFPSEEDLRSFLLDTAQRFSNLTELPLSEIGRQALNDTAFFFQLEKGRTFKMRTFENLMTWLDRNWPTEERCHGATARKASK